MSKLDIRMSYKDACILKHALRNQCEDKENHIEFNRDGYTKEGLEVEMKLLSEEKAALERFTEQINECGIKHNRNMFKEEAK